MIEEERATIEGIVAGYKRDLDGLRDGTYPRGIAENIADIIKKAVKGKVTTWKALGITSAQLNKLVEKAGAK